MTNDQTAMLARYGLDYAEAMERFCGNESLFARIAVKYLDDPHVDALEAAMASGDAAAAEREAHSLKGVAGNLSFVRLYDLAARVTDALRANDIDSARTPHARPAREPRCRAGSAEEPGRVGTFDLDALAGIEAEAPTLSPSHGRTARSSRLRPIQCPPR